MSSRNKHVKELAFLTALQRANSAAGNSVGYGVSSLGKASKHQRNAATHKRLSEERKKLLEKQDKGDLTKTEEHRLEEIERILSQHFPLTGVSGYGGGDMNREEFTETYNPEFDPHALADLLKRYFGKEKGENYIHRRYAHLTKKNRAELMSSRAGMRSILRKAMRKWVEKKRAATTRTQRKQLEEDKETLKTAVMMYMPTGVTEYERNEFNETSNTNEGDHEENALTLLQRGVLKGGQTRRRRL